MNTPKELIEQELGDLFLRDYAEMVNEPESDPMLSEIDGHVLTYDELTQGE